MNSSIAEQFPQSESRKKEVVSSQESHLPEGMILPFNVEGFVDIIENLAEQAAQLSDREKQFSEKIYTSVVEGLSQAKSSVKKILDELKFHYSFHQAGRDLIKNRAREKTPSYSRAQKLATALLLFSTVLAACSPKSAEASAPAEPTPITVTATPQEAPNGGEVTPTPIPLENLDITYADKYEGNETQVNTILERAWDLISRHILTENLAIPGAIEVEDVSNDNVIVEVLQQGRADDYPEGTHFTISYVDGHSGEILTVTLEGANSVLSAGSSPAVELAIGTNQLPVGLDANGRAVSHVDGQTGQWVAGGTELAPDPVAETPEPESVNPIIDLSQATLEHPITSECKDQFPLIIDEGLAIACFVFDNWVRGPIELSDGYEMIIGAEGWMEQNGEKIPVLIPLATANRKKNQMQLHNYITQEFAEYIYDTDEAFWENHLRIKPGQTLYVALGIPNESLADNSTDGFGFEVVTFTQEEIEEVMRTGDFSILGNVIWPAIDIDARDQ